MNIPKILYNPIKRKFDSRGGIPIYCDLNGIKFDKEALSDIKARKNVISNWRRQQAALDAIRKLSDGFISKNRNTINDYLDLAAKPKYSKSSGNEEKIKKLQKEINDLKKKEDDCDRKIKSIKDNKLRKYEPEERKYYIISAKLDSKGMRVGFLTSQFNTKSASVIDDAIEKIEKIKSISLNYQNFQRDDVRDKYRKLHDECVKCISFNNDSKKRILEDESNLKNEYEKVSDEIKLIERKKKEIFYKESDKEEELYDLQEESKRKSESKELDKDYKRRLDDSIRALESIFITSDDVFDKIKGKLIITDWERPKTPKDKYIHQIRKRTETYSSRNDPKRLRSHAVEAAFGFSLSPNVKNKFSIDIEWWKSNLDKTYSGEEHYRFILENSPEEFEKEIRKDRYFFEHEVRYNRIIVKAIEFIEENTMYGVLMRMIMDGIEKYCKEGSLESNGVLAFSGKNPEISKLIDKNLMMSAKRTFDIQSHSRAYSLMIPEYQDRFSSILKELVSIGIRDYTMIANADYTLLKPYIAYDIRNKFGRFAKENLGKFLSWFFGSYGDPQISKLGGFDKLLENYLQSEEEMREKNLYNERSFVLARERKIFWNDEYSRYVGNVGKVRKSEVEKNLKALEEMIKKTEINKTIRKIVKGKDPAFQSVRYVLKSIGVFGKFEEISDFLSKKGYKSSNKTSDFIKGEAYFLAISKKWSETNGKTEFLKKLANDIKSFYSMLGRLQKFRSVSKELPDFRNSKFIIPGISYRVRYFFKAGRRRNLHSALDNEKLFAILRELNNGYDFIQFYIDCVLPYKSVSKKADSYASNMLAVKRFDVKRNREIISDMINEDFFRSLHSGTIPLWYSPKWEWTEYKIRKGYSAMKFIMSGEFAKSVGFSIELLE